MQFRCVLMRHGQATSSHPMGDRLRPLTPRGQEQAAALGPLLEERGWSPVQILSSDATRALETANAVSQHWQPSLPLQVCPMLYLSTHHAISHELSAEDFQSLPCVLLVGHNPGWSSAVTHWSGVPLALDVAEAALLTVEAEHWNEACQMSGSWELVEVLSSGR